MSCTLNNPGCLWLTNAYHLTYVIYPYFIEDLSPVVLQNIRVRKIIVIRGKENRSSCFNSQQVNLSRDLQSLLPIAKPQHCLFNFSGKQLRWKNSLRLCSFSLLGSCYTISSKAEQKLCVTKKTKRSSPFRLLQEFSHTAFTELNPSQCVTWGHTI